jgi:hypothetical protein
MIGPSIFFLVDGLIYHIGCLENSYIISSANVAKINLMNTMKYERIQRKQENVIKIRRNSWEGRKREKKLLKEP